ncbi:MAG: serine/threonine-protein kinase [Anaerolineales bacterium]|nr:serine/threonine-protein kinase [Anaerolineales bacterium]MCB9110029.1 serine/threonine-protein kinase [Anaerolineales bacterium]
MTLDKGILIHNRYRIVDILGQGGMGSVYRAIDENLGVSVALKENLFTTDEYARQFRLEAVILANLRHPNLPRVSDHFVLGDMGQYLVMDFIEGEDLRYRMERVGMLAEEEAVHIGASMCDALAYLHTRKPPILHRDIKPGNVKISPDGHIFLVDFGLAKVYQSASQATTTGARAMTPGYSPPEQYGTARTDPRTDIYSLGATLYAALTGVIPEDGLARAMDNAQLTPLRKRNPKISRKLAAAIEKAMAVDPSDRFQTAEGFKTGLLASKSLTQQAPGSYKIIPPPPEALESSHEEQSTIVDENLPVNGDKPPRAKIPGPVPSILSSDHEDQPFVSPLKRQKERERKRRLALVRFALYTGLLLLILGGVLYFVPGLLPDDVRAMVPFIAPTATQTLTPTPVPTQTIPPTFTATLEEPTATNTPKPTQTMTPTFTPTPVAGAPTEELVNTPTLVPAPMLGGGAGQIAFASTRTGIPQIFLADLNGENAFQVTNMASGACQPSWSPDGMKMVFISPCPGNEDKYKNTSLYVINADGTGLITLDASPGGNFDPSWSPDGKTIAFTSLRTGQMEIFTIDVDDPDTVTQITKGASQFESRMPRWSPDASQLVYVVKRLGVYQIWLMNADGTEQKQIVRSGVQYSDYLPEWSPKNDLIIFNQRCATKFCNPYLMSISATDHSSEQGLRLPISIAFIENIDYSPDGFYIAYEGVGEAGNMDIFYMTLSGGDRVRLSTDPAQDFQPTWRPATPEP